jgi:BASS family bile acid:Na+ symporter
MVTDLFRFFVAHLIELFMLAVGLAAQPGAVVRAVRSRPRLYARALVVLYVAVPLLTIGIAEVLALPPGLAALLVVFGVCPAAPLVVPRLMKKDAAAGVTALALVTLASSLAPVLVPLWLLIVNRILGSSLVVAPSALLTVFLVKVLVPFVLGVIVRRASPRVADRLAPVCASLATAALCVAVLLILKPSYEAVRHLKWTALLALVLVAFGSAALAVAAAGPARSDRDAFAAVAMTGSPALALAVIRASYPGLRNVIGILGAFIILRALAGLPYHWLRAWRRRAAAGPAEVRV